MQHINVRGGYTILYVVEDVIDVWYTKRRTKNKTSKEKTRNLFIYLLFTTINNFFLESEKREKEKKWQLYSFHLTNF
jgi:hypothetical protein